MRPALLLIDLQYDYLHQPGLDPPSHTLVRHVADLLGACRQGTIPVAYAITLVQPDGSNRMPHWRRRDYWACVEGTEGVKMPPDIAPQQGEEVFPKPFFSAFANVELLAQLKRWHVDTLILGGVHAHGCIRATVLDAYQAGFEVWVAEEAVGSYDPVHARISRDYLDGRACRWLSLAAIRARLGATKSTANGGGVSRACGPLPVSFIEGEWQAAMDHRLQPRHDPTDWPHCLAVVPTATEADVSAATSATARCQRDWARLPLDRRAAYLESWAAALQRRRDNAIALIVSDLGKPVVDAIAEFDYGLALLSATIRSTRGDASATPAAGIAVHHRPVGTVGIITPWNNPLALPVGKIAPALLWGNAVVWKPAMQAPRLTMLLIEALTEAGFPSGCVSMVFGDATTGQAMLGERAITALSFTGSIAAGRQVALGCARYGKALQAELGGNNAAVIGPDCDVVEAAGELAAAAFSFAGQRCTAPRRLIVHAAVEKRFLDALDEALDHLLVGMPREASTRIGPVVCRAARQRISHIVAEAEKQGITIHRGGEVPKGYEDGCWYAPTVLTGASQNAPVVQQESFGPVVVVQRYDEAGQAISMVNGVEQGLVATLYSHDPEMKRRFGDSVEAGILRINAGQQGIHPEAPFGGWKASGIGLPEHGPWDRTFYTRPQAIYGDNPV